MRVTPLPKTGPPFSGFSSPDARAKAESET